MQIKSMDISEVHLQGAELCLETADGRVTTPPNKEITLMRLKVFNLVNPNQVKYPGM